MPAPISISRSAAMPTVRRPVAHLPSRWRRAALDAVVPFLVPLVLVLIWAGIVRTGVVPRYVLPPPSAVLAELRELADDGDLAYHGWASLLRVASGFAGGTIAGTIFGALTGTSRLGRKLFDATLQGFRAVPVIAWVPLFILWLGIGEASKVTMIALGAFFPVYLGLMGGIAGVDRKLIEVGRVNRLTGLRLIFRVHLHAALPAYLTGLRVGLGLSWMFVAAAELMGASEGFGFLLLDGESKGRPELVISCLLLFAAAGKATDLLMAIAERRLLRWQDTERTT